MTHIPGGTEPDSPRCQCAVQTACSLTLRNLFLGFPLGFFRPWVTVSTGSWGHGGCMEESCLQRLLFNKMLNFLVLSSVFKYDASFWFLKTCFSCVFFVCVCPCSGVAVTELGPLAPLTGNHWFVLEQIALQYKRQWWRPAKCPNII